MTISGVTVGKYLFCCQKTQKIRKACGLSFLLHSDGLDWSITAVCIMFHQLNRKHDKELLRNNRLFNSVLHSIVLHNKISAASHTQHTLSLFHLKNNKPGKKGFCERQTGFRGFPRAGQPRLWGEGALKARLNERQDLLAAIRDPFFFFFSWKDYSQLYVSQVWTEWESGQMAKDCSLEFAKRYWV